MNWFRRKKLPDEKSPGGSLIFRHDRIFAPRIAPSEESAGAFRRTRAEVYGRYFGETGVPVSEETVPLVPRIDVHTYYRRAEGRRVCALVTCGMSDLEMDAPDSGIRRAELIFYCDEPKPEYIDTIRWLAHFPHNQKTWIGYFTTIPNGNPPEPIWDSLVLDTILFLPPIVTRDQALPEELVLQGEPVHLLWLVPISTAECNLKLAKGSEALLNLFEQRRHPHVFDPMRKSYI